MATTLNFPPAVITAKLPSAASAFGLSSATAAATEVVEWFDTAPFVPSGWQALGDTVLNGWGTIEITPLGGTPYKFAGKFRGSFGHKWEQRIPYGKDSAIPVWAHRKSTEINALIKILSPVDLANYTALVAQLYRQNASAAVAVGVASTPLSVLGVRQLYFTAGDVPEVPDRPGQTPIFTLRFQTWLPPGFSGVGGSGPSVAGASASAGSTTAALSAATSFETASAISSATIPVITGELANAIGTAAQAVSILNGVAGAPTLPLAPLAFIP